MGENEIRQENGAEKPERLHRYLVEVSFFNPISKVIEEHEEVILSSDPETALTVALSNYQSEIDDNHFSQFNADVYDGQDKQGERKVLATLHPKVA